MKQTKVKQPVSLPALLKKTEKKVNEFIRKRDAGQMCISCGSNKANQAGHYFAVKTCSILRFHPVNINLQCAGCNCWKDGNAPYYRIGLVEKWGEEMAEEIERIATDPLKRLYKWSRFELEQIINEINNGTYGENYKPITNT